MIGWIGIFNPGSAFSNYVGYIRKSGFFHEEPLFWDASAMENAVAALKLKGAGDTDSLISSESIA